VNEVAGDLCAGVGPWFPVVTCEHGGNRVPARYAELFTGARRVLASHRAFDRGALELARRLAARLGAPRVTATVTRLLVDWNRSPGHPGLYSEFTARLDPAERRAIFERYWGTYRDRVRSLIDEAVGRGARLLHVSVHTFTPVLNGSTRRADVGLLYDPARPLERSLCLTWQRSLRTRRPDLLVRRNYPYLGIRDGLTTWLRRRFGPQHYAGIELEVNQRWPRQGGRSWKQLKRDLADTLAASLSGSRLA